MIEGGARRGLPPPRMRSRAEARSYGRQVHRVTRANADMRQRPARSKVARRGLPFPHILRWPRSGRFTGSRGPTDNMRAAHGFRKRAFVTLRYRAIFRRLPSELRIAPPGPVAVHSAANRSQKNPPTSRPNAGTRPGENSRRKRRFSGELSANIRTLRRYHASAHF